MKGVNRWNDLSLLVLFSVRMKPRAQGCESLLTFGRFIYFQGGGGFKGAESPELTAVRTLISFLMCSEYNNILLFGWSCCHSYIRRMMKTTNSEKRKRREGLSFDELAKCSGVRCSAEQRTNEHEPNRRRLLLK